MSVWYTGDVMGRKHQGERKTLKILIEYAPAPDARERLRRGMDLVLQAAAMEEREETQSSLAAPPEALEENDES